MKEMKHYLDLVSVSEKVRKKQTRMIRVCITLAVFLAASIFSMADLEIRSQIYQTVQSNGSWQAAFTGLTEEQEKLVRARAEVKDAALLENVEAETSGCTVDGMSAAVSGVDEDLTELLPMLKVQEGRLPEKEDEAAVTETAAGQLGIREGSQVTLHMADGQDAAFTVTGILEDASGLNSEEAVGLFVDLSAFEKYFASQDAADTMLLVRFRMFCNVEKTVDDLCAQIGIDPASAALNSKLLALQFQSSDTYMAQLYAVAAVLAVLVTTAGVLMISGSMNSSVARRIRFFGMMRCLGADQRQVRRFVRREALNWCRTAIPVGLGISVAVVWALCAVLKTMSPVYFSGMPMFGVSVPGLLAGAVIGLGTVLLAARSPAKRASKVSPLTAVSGNAGSTHAVRRAAHARFFPVEAALGIHHAVGSRKNFLLMAGSFAFSIILFLSFSPALDFMDHGIKPLRPSAPDLTISSTDGSCSVPKDLAEELSGDPAVKRVYGRSRASAVPARAGDAEFQIDLNSYEENQFRWAEDSVAEGSLKDAEEGRGVMAVTMDAARDFTPGEEITIDFPSGAETVTVSGVLNGSAFNVTPGSTVLVCSEALFEKLAGETDYTTIDLQLEPGASDQDVERICAMAGEGFSVADNREENSEVRGAYYSFALFLYGFLAVIALISVFYIINSIAMSVSARLRQYGAMRAIGMTGAQLVRMVAAEALTYVAGGMAAGCAAGLLLNWKIYGLLVTSRWGDPWQVPAAALAVILTVMALAAAAAVAGPARRIREMSVVDTLGAM